MININQISEKPIVLKGDDPIFGKMINIINNEIKNFDAVPFEFKSYSGKVVAEKFRTVYPISFLFENIQIKELLREFAKNCIPEFLYELRKILDCQTYEYTKYNSGKYCLRVRVFEDKEGYSLQPHLDSKDTIFSFILHLNSENPKTTIYNLDKIHTITNLNKSIEVEEIDYLCQIIKKLGIKSNLEFGEAQFSETVGIWSDDCFFKYLYEKNKLYILQYKESQINISQGEIYGLNNARYGLFKSSKIKEFNNETYHGVRPSKIKQRKMLIMDLLVGENDGDYLKLDGINKDPYTYYILFKHEKNNTFNSILK